MMMAAPDSGLVVLAVYPKGKAFTKLASAIDIYLVEPLAWMVLVEVALQLCHALLYPWAVHWIAVLGHQAGEAQ